MSDDEFEREASTPDWRLSFILTSLFFFSVYYVRACSANTLRQLHTNTTHTHTKHKVETVVSCIIHEPIKLFPQVILIPLDRRHSVLSEEKVEMCAISMW